MKGGSRTACEKTDCWISEHGGLFAYWDEKTRRRRNKFFPGRHISFYAQNIWQTGGIATFVAANGDYAGFGAEKPHCTGEDLDHTELKKHLDIWLVLAIRN